MKGYRVYSNLESILLQKDISIHAEDEILSLYKADLSQDLLISQLKIFHSSNNYSLPSADRIIHDVIALMQGFSAVMSQVDQVKLLMMMPATNAIYEGSFSAMR